MKEFCTENGYTPLENEIQAAINDLVSKELAQPISTRIAGLVRNRTPSEQNKRAIEALEQIQNWHVQPDDSLARDFIATIRSALKGE